MDTNGRPLRDRRRSTADVRRPAYATSCISSGPQPLADRGRARRCVRRVDRRIAQCGRNGDRSDNHGHSPADGETDVNAVYADHASTTAVTDHAAGTTLVPAPRTIVYDDACNHDA